MTTTQIINHLVLIYSKPVNRATVLKASVYVTDDGRKNALGQCLINPYTNGVLYAYPLERTDSKGVTITEWISGDQIERFDDSLLQPQYRGHSPRFWRELEHLHDHDAFYNATGFSQEGTDYIITLKQRWK